MWVKVIGLDLFSFTAGLKLVSGEVEGVNREMQKI